MITLLSQLLLRRIRRRVRRIGGIIAVALALAAGVKAGARDVPVVLHSGSSSQLMRVPTSSSTAALPRDAMTGCH